MVTPELEFAVKSRNVGVIGKDDRYARSARRLHDRDAVGDHVREDRQHFVRSAEDVDDEHRAPGQVDLI